MTTGVRFNYLALMAGSRVISSRYQLNKPLGQGGMGVVWEGYDQVLRRPVAVKQLLLPERSEPGQDRELKARFLREARSVASLDHPSVVSVHDVVEDADGPWMVMQFVKGRSLQQLIEEDGPLPVARVAEIGLALLDALECAHAQGIVHRDLKPANVMVADDGKVVLTDFGIAAVANATYSLTRTGQLIGSLGYIAPERFSFGTIDGRSDLWSLGATLYYAVEAKRAFRADDGPDIHIARLLMGEQPEFERAERLEPVIKGLLEKDLDRRLGIDQARRQLKTIANGKTVPPFPPPPHAPTKTFPKFPPRRAVVIPLVLLVIIALITAAVINYTGQRKGHDQTGQRESPVPSAVVKFETIPDICGSLSGKMILDNLIDHRRPSDSKTDTDERKCGWETESSATVPVDGRLTLTARKFPSADQAAAYIEKENGKKSIFGGSGYTGLGEPGEIGDQAIFRVWEEIVDKTRGGDVYHSSNTTEIIFRTSNLVVEVDYGRHRGGEPKPDDTARARQGAELMAREAASSLGS
ncbi:serine/threonine-protein kinase [Actinomadura sp. HBU206391]|uniref:serine/threonine-protein kinase n=1 Tax=Actinomadura sp. HBU206391 TaxID=2731692 RepID=UPI0016508388|nr:serine/threonine-protein kinase [Actinomadura sp. HBU206391]MBC6457084.1 serine/threonine protein kinase [Actinomadura sp. HBU206391]